MKALLQNWRCFLYLFKKYKIYTLNIINTSIISVIIIVSAFIASCNTSNENSNISLKGKRLDKTILYGENQRQYRLYIPSSYSRKEPLPLLIALHGMESDIDKMERRTRLSKKAEEENFILVYPAGSGQFEDILLTWNVSFCCGYSMERNIDDVGFIDTLIDEIINNFNIDTDKIFAVGFSNGGMLAYRVGAELSHRIAGVAVVSGSIGGKTFQVSSPYKIPKPEKEIPIIIFHGKKDAVIPYDGGQPKSQTLSTAGAYSYLSVDKAVSFWVSNNECDVAPEISTIKEGKIAVDVFRNCKDDANVVLYTLNEGQHSWPGGVKIGEDGEMVDCISATDIIWGFLNN